MRHTKCYVPYYPRPQFVRRDWLCLNGEWKFAFGDEVAEAEAVKGNLARVINVPFTYETKLSGIEDDSMHHTVWYSRTVKGKEGKRTILTFEGADYITEVYVSGRLVGTHKGAYSRFSFDITDHLCEGEAVLAVKCIDPDHPIQVRGKQRWEKDSFGCWYVQTTGIYKTVWLEYVDETHLTKLKITPNIHDYSVMLDLAVSKPCEDVIVEAEISFNGRHVQTASIIAADIDNTINIRLDSKTSPIRQRCGRFGILHYMMLR